MSLPLLPGEIGPQRTRDLAVKVISCSPCRVAYIDLELRVQFANPAWLVANGLGPEAIGSSLHQLIDPQTHESWLPFIARVLGGEQVENVGTVIERDGKTRAFRITRTPDVQHGSVVGYFVYATDVTELVESERRYKAANKAAELAQRFTNIISDALPVRISFWDEGLRCRFVNRCYREWYGRPEEHFLGRNHQELHDDLPAEDRLALLRRALAGADVVHEHEGESASGRYGIFNVHLIPIKHEGVIAGVLAIAVDVTAEREAQANLRDLNAELSAGRDRAEAGARAKSAFLANMSHEIRTPMNAIIGLTHILSSEEHSRTTKDRLANISDASEHLLRLINDVLDVSKIDAGKLRIDESRFDLPAMLGRCVTMVMSQAMAKGLRLEVVNRVESTQWVADEGRLSQMLVNLLSNAVKFSDRGTVQIVCSSRQSGPTSQLLFEVVDQGIGVDPKRLPELFSAFEQADVSTTRRYGGTGLGLALTRQLARLMEGDAGGSSVLGEGSTFWFTARAAIATDRRCLPTAADAHQSSTRLRAHHAGKRLLLAEDNLINQMVAVSLLEGAGLIVDVAGDGAQAVEMAERGGYALVLMDMQMPRMDGIEAAALIRSNSSRAQVPIVALTANAFEHDRTAALAAGMDDFLS